MAFSGSNHRQMTWGGLCSIAAAAAAAVASAGWSGAAHAQVPDASPPPAAAPAEKYLPGYTAHIDSVALTVALGYLTGPLCPQRGLRSPPVGRFISVERKASPYTEPSRQELLAELGEHPPGPVMARAHPIGAWQLGAEVRQGDQHWTKLATGARERHNPVPPGSTFTVVQRYKEYRAANPMHPTEPSMWTRAGADLPAPTPPTTASCFSEVWLRINDNRWSVLESVHNRVIFTTGLLEDLSASERLAVLAYEAGLAIMEGGSQLHQPQRSGFLGLAQGFHPELGAYGREAWVMAMADWYAAHIVQALGMDFNAYKAAFLAVDSRMGNALTRPRGYNVLRGVSVFRKRQLDAWSKTLADTGQLPSIDEALASAAEGIALPSRTWPTAEDVRAAVMRGDVNVPRAWVLNQLATQGVVAKKP